MLSPKTAKVFIAYSHLDVRFRHELEKQLTLLQRKRHLDWWSEHQLAPGDEKNAWLSEAIQKADFILLLISIHFLSDDFCWSQQLEKAIERHDNGEAVVIPVFVRPCAWEDTPIERLEGVPPKGKAISNWSDKHEAWTQAARGIQKALVVWEKKQSKGDAGAIGTGSYRPRNCREKTKKREGIHKKHIFISYCHDNKDEVARLVEELKNAGESVWWDEDILGGRDWKEAIRMAMKDAMAVVVCLSPELTEERYHAGVYPEIRDAIATFRKYGPGHAFIFPIKLGKCDIPLIELDDTRTMDRLQSINLYPESKRAAGVRKLLASLAAAPGHS